MKSFYTELEPIKDFKQVTQFEHYTHCPDDWIVVLTDIRGSTKAIESGRYRDVNLMGAAAIVAIQNTLGERELPFAFGGDGATLLIPPASRVKVEKEMLALKHHCRQQFQLELRVGLIPVREIYQKNATLMVGKFEVSNKNYISLFYGNGFAVAESILKSDGTHELIGGGETPGVPNLDNLTCRWSPFPSRNGEIAAVLIAARNPQSANNIYEEILRELELFISKDHFNPIRTQAMKPRSFADRLSYENKLHRNIPALRRFLSFMLQTLFVFTKGTELTRYINEIPGNSDYKKLDGIIKMVIDCSSHEKKQLIETLERYKKRGIIFYGLHFSPTAVMTCVVHQSKENQHIHFVDGGDGGYALAAKMLKSQLKMA
jgi:hypothetical protein